MTTSATEWPSIPVPEPIKELITRFFVVGDTPTAEAGREMGEEIFTADGKIVVNKKVISGTAELSNHWAPGLKARKHIVHKIYCCNDTGDDLMLIGSVTWDFNDGSSENGTFAARALIEEGGSEKPKLKIYQGWADLSDFMAGVVARQSERAGNMVNALCPSAIATGLKGFVEVSGTVESLTDEGSGLAVEENMLVQLDSPLAKAEESGSV